MGVGDRAAHVLVVAERVQEADALGTGEDQVVAGNRREGLRLVVPETGRLVERAHRDRSLPGRRPQSLALGGAYPAKERPEVAVTDDAPPDQARQPPEPVHSPGDSSRPA